MVRALGVKSAFDFRGVEERTGGVCVVNEITVHSLPIEPTVVASLRAELARGALTGPVALELMRESYRNYVRHNTHSFRMLFGHLLEDRAPLVIHCTAGKDRTGWAAALILLALGVSREAVREDYLLTNQLYRRPAELAAKAAQSVPQDILDVLWRVQMPFLDSAFALAEQHAGSMDRYLAEVLGVDAAARQRLAQRYLEG